MGFTEIGLFGVDVAAISIMIVPCAITIGPRRLAGCVGLLSRGLSGGWRRS
jgi:hypothetical protein